MPTLRIHRAPRYTEAMAFIIDDAFLPATLTAHPMTDEEFAVSARNIPISSLR